MVIGIDASRANKRYKTGTEWYSFYLIKSLAEIDKNNQYILYTLEPPSQGFLNLGPNFRHKILDWPPKRLWTQVRFSGHLLKIGLTKSERPDLLFVPAHTIPVFHPITVTTCHDLGFERYPQMYNKTERLYQLWSLKYALKKAQKIIAVSNFTKNELIRLHSMPEDKIKVVYHGYNQDVFKPVPKELADQTAVKYGLRPDQYLIFVGRLEAKKNILGLLMAFKILKTRPDHKDLQLALVGIPGFKFEEAEKYIARENLSDAVKKLGWVQLEDLPYLFRSASAFVFPSFYEGFGIPILEAMACQTLICASKIAPIEEVAGNSIMYFDPNNVPAMADVISQAVKNRSKLINSGTADWQETVSRYRWQKSAQETLSLLNSI